MVISENQIGTFYRNSIEHNDTNLVKGIISGEKTFEDFKEKIDPEEKTMVIKTFSEIYLEIMECLKDSAAMGFQEDFNFLRLGEDSHSYKNRGKLFLIDQSDFEVQQIFFDDHFDEGKKSLIDTWDVFTKERIPIESVKNKFAIKVDTIRAILDQEYFIKGFNEAFASRNKDFKNL